MLRSHPGAVRAITRAEGEATLHPSSLMHAVTRMSGQGKRYALIVFFGRNARIVAFVRNPTRAHAALREPTLCIMRPLFASFGLDDPRACCRAALTCAGARSRCWLLLV